MRCGGCGFDAPADFAFCPKCGGKLQAVCPSCSFACAPDFAFCPKCGARVADRVPQAAPPARPPEAERLATLQELMPAALDRKVRAEAEAGAAEGERRPVTVLFADIAGFTALSEALDAEEVATLVDRCLRTMADAIYRYEGTVDKYIGDCVMALFGAPIAHEDDPERAIRAALEMRDSIVAINDELAEGWRHGASAQRPELSLHVGINTGVVVAGAVGSDRRRDYTVLGDAVNVASRLQSAATSGEILVGEHTCRLASHAVAFEPLGPISLKGKAEATTAYRVRGLLVAPRSARGLEGHGLAAPLIGRDEELGQLVAAFDRMRHGRTQVVSIVGEAGAGKSRLIRELFERLESDGVLQSERVQVLRAACSALGQQTYGVFASLCREAFGVAGQETPEAAQRKVAAGLARLGQDAAAIAHSAPLVGHLLGLEFDDPRLRHLEPEQLKRQLFMAVREVLQAQVRCGPTMLVVEDLHWADAASVELLRFLVDRLGEGQLLVLLAHRPTFDASALVGARTAYTAIALGPLPSTGSAALLDAFFGASASRFPERLRDLVVARAGGNPLYVEEIVRNLVEAGVLVHGPDGWACAAEPATVDVPPTLHGVLLARLDRLPPGARRLVQEAAVLGIAFGERLLRAVCQDADALQHHLDVLQSAELIEESPPTAGAVAPAEAHYRFPHALVHDVAYQSLLVRRRTELHGRAARTLVEMRGERPERLEDLEALGQHFSLSAEKATGARYLLAAGDWARRMYANEDAAHHYRRALETLRACDEATTRVDRLAACERLADVLGLAGRREEALEHYAAALDGHAERGDHPAQARLQRKIAGLHWDAGDRERARAHYDAGLALLGDRPAHVEQAHLYNQMGRLAFRSGDNQAAVTWAERALALAEALVTSTAPEQSEVAAAVAEANNTLGVALARSGKLEEAVARIERSADVAHEHDLPQVACRAYTNLGVLYSTLDPAKAIETCLHGLELAKKIGDLGFQSWLYANLAGAYCTFTGQCEEEGIAAAQASVELDRQLGQLDHLAVPLIVLGQIHQCHGDARLALECYQEALVLAEGMREPQLLFPCYDGLATLYLEMGDEGTAEAYLRKGQEVCEQAGYDPESLLVLPFLG